MNILVTGANGFVGAALCEHLAQLGHVVTAVVRDKKSLSISELLAHNLCALEADFTVKNSLFEALKGQNCVIHCAARVHQVRETAAKPLQEYLRINTEATLNLARDAAQAGVKRFVFLSSVKVHGDWSARGQPFKDEESVPAAFEHLDPYGLSKWKAEQGLYEISRETDMEIVIIRPPLIYGAGVKANFESAMRFIERGIPLPFGAVQNRRSLVALPNLIDLIALCIEHPKATGQSFLVSDQSDLSTPELLDAIGQALGKKARLVSIPMPLLQTALKLIGKGAAGQRLTQDLAVDSSKASQLLGWKPKLSLQEALKPTTAYFLKTK